MLLILSLSLWNLIDALAISRRTQKKGQTILKISKMIYHHTMRSNVSHRSYFDVKRIYFLISFRESLKDYESRRNFMADALTFCSETSWLLCAKRISQRVFLLSINDAAITEVTIADYSIDRSDIAHECAHCSTRRVYICDNVHFQSSKSSVVLGCLYDVVRIAVTSHRARGRDPMEIAPTYRDGEDQRCVSG